MYYSSLFNMAGLKSSHSTETGPSRQACLIIHFQFYLQSHFNVSQAAPKIIAFLQSTSSFAHILLIKMSQEKENNLNLN